MARDYYLELPLHLMGDPSMLRLMRKRGLEGVGVYVGLCAALTIAYNEGRGIDLDDLDALAYSWHYGADELRDVCSDMAEVGLISPELWGEGKVGIEMVAERAMFKAKKAAAGAAGGRARAINAGQELHEASA